MHVTKTRRNDLRLQKFHVKYEKRNFFLIEWLQRGTACLSALLTLRVRLRL